jgi:type IV pilus biogenesis protein CpaD/CtpE
MKIRYVLLALASSAALALVACGEDKSSGAAAEKQASPTQAIAEIGNVEGALDTALAQVKSGDRAAAEETVSQAYVDHFEKVEGPLEKVDPEVKEKLEEAISSTLRDKIKSGAPAAEVQALVTQIKADLATAKAKLGA